MEQLRFLTPENIEQIRIDFGTPTFVYDEDTLRANAKSVLNFPNAFGLYPRYAMKSAPTGAILRIFNSEGLGIDASSEFEVERAVRAGYGTESISMSTQEFPENFRYWVQDGVHVNLCSLNQIHKFGIWGKGESIGLRFNPGMGSGGTNRTNVGGPSSSFGIWKEDLEEAKKLLKALSGKTHEVITGVYLYTRRETCSFAVSTRVTFDALKEEEIDHYVQHFPVLDKAGSYGIQDWIGLVGVKKIEGSYTNVMGLPTLETHQNLQKIIKKGAQGPL